MNTFESSLNQYVLHDTVITCARLNSDSITFIFEQGVFFSKPNQPSLNKTSTCSMNLYIKDFDKNSLYQNIEIKTIDNGFITEVSFDDLSKSIKKGGLKIYLDYYSFFAKSVLLIGNTEDFEFEITITDIEKIDFAL